MKKITILFALFGAMALMAQNPVETSARRSSQWPPQAGGSSTYGGMYKVAWKAVPTTLTDLDTQTMIVSGYCFYNSTGGSLTLTIQTKDATSLPLPLSGPLAAGTSACFSFAPGLEATGGVSISTTATGVYYTAIWSH